jgi:RimJ/RimL family protein N-acetyltransferase
VNSATLFSAGPYRCVELTAEDLPRLQRFLEDNPEYYHAVNGAPPGPEEARQEFEFELPAEWPFEKKWLLGFTREDGSLVAMAGLISNLFAPGVWHIGLLIVATSLHGSGTARTLYRELESWMLEQDARWVRLGVVVGNARAERFWDAMGYADLRIRRGMQMGEKTNDLRVMAKPLRGGSFAEYLDLVPRDRSEAP